MNKKFPLCFEVYFRSDVYESRDINSQLLTYEIMLKSLAQICIKFVFSLRYLYNPSNSQNLKLFLLINPLSGLEDDEMLEKVYGLMTRGSLSRFYSFNYIETGFPNLDWVSSIGEVTKHGEFIDQPGFIGYLPHLFETDLVDKNFSLMELLERGSYQELILEFSLETYNSPNEKVHWSSAIDDLVRRLSNSSSRNSSINHALDLYRKYQDSYSRNQLFNYNIKALGRDPGDTFAILQILIEVTSKRNAVQKINPIITFNSNDPNFAKS